MITDCLRIVLDVFELLSLYLLNSSSQQQCKPLKLRPRRWIGIFKLSELLKLISKYYGSVCLTDEIPSVPDFGVLYFSNSLRLTLLWILWCRLKNKLKKILACLTRLANWYTSVSPWEHISVFAYIFLLISFCLYLIEAFQIVLNLSIEWHDLILVPYKRIMIRCLDDVVACLSCLESISLFL